jgi:hypothetical protein
MTAPGLLLYAAGGFAVVLGVLHFSFPRRFGFLTMLAGDRLEVPQFQLGFYRHNLKRSDLRGIVYVMNHCVSYAIVAAGVFDLFNAKWLGTFPGSVASGVVAGFWFTRAGTQFYLGRRRGDWLVFSFFAGLGVLQLIAAFG